MTNSALKQVADLPNRSISELKELWQKLFKSTPPPYNKLFLVKRLAYRIQELAFGGLPQTTERHLKSLAEGKENLPSPPSTTMRDCPVAGTRLVREWKGVEHCCTVLDDGFEYQGRKFGSLSAVANTITGTRWNGLIFFGIRRTGGAKQQKGEK
ncbi:MAG: DUF2924 domain-containing protein [Magnetococcales bacterium]|nr:DUF2924 domain-containing protein [Magnetococcales bacterium]